MQFIKNNYDQYKPTLQHKPLDPLLKPMYPNLKLEDKVDFQWENIVIDTLPD